MRGRRRYRPKAGRRLPSDAIHVNAGTFDKRRRAKPMPHYMAGTKPSPLKGMMRRGRRSLAVGLHPTDVLHTSSSSTYGMPPTDAFYLAGGVADAAQWGPRVTDEHRGEFAGYKRYALDFARMHPAGRGQHHVLHDAFETNIIAGNPSSFGFLSTKARSGLPRRRGPSAVPVEQRAEKWNKSMRLSRDAQESSPQKGASLVGEVDDGGRMMHEAEELYALQSAGELSASAHTCYLLQEEQRRHQDEIEARLRQEGRWPRGKNMPLRMRPDFRVPGKLGERAEHRAELYS